MDELATAKELGLVEVFRKAGDEVLIRGLSKGLAKGPNGTVDAWGALCLGVGAKYDDLSDSFGAMARVLPDKPRAALGLAYWLSCKEAGQEVSEWSDQVSRDAVGGLFLDLANKVEAAEVVPVNHPARGATHPASFTLPPENIAFLAPGDGEQVLGGVEVPD